MLVNIVSHHREHDTTTTLKWGEVVDKNIELELVDTQDGTLLTVENIQDMLRGQVGNTIIGKTVIVSPSNNSAVGRTTELFLDPYTPLPAYTSYELTHIEWITASDPRCTNILTRTIYTPADALDGNIKKHKLSATDLGSPKIYVKARYRSGNFCTFWSPIMEYRVEESYVKLPVLTVTANETEPTIRCSAFELLADLLPPGTRDSLEKVVYGIEQVANDTDIDDPVVIARLQNNYTPTYTITKSKNNTPYELTFPSASDSGSTVKLNPNTTYLITAKLVGGSYASNIGRKLVKIDDYQILTPEARIVDNRLTPKLVIENFRVNKGSDTLKDYTIKVYKQDNDNDPTNDEMIYTVNITEQEHTFTSGLLKPNETYTILVTANGNKFGSSVTKEIIYTLPFTGIKTPIVEVLTNGLIPKVTVSPFLVVGDTDTFRQTEWEIHDQAAKVDGNGNPLPTLVKRIVTPAPTTAIDIAKGTLEMNSNYIAKARYIGAKYTSDWGIKRFKTIEVRVKRPILQVQVRGLNLIADIDEYLVYGEDDVIENVEYKVTEVRIESGTEFPVREIGEYQKPKHDRILNIGYSEGIRANKTYKIVAKVIGKKYNSPASEAAYGVVGNIFIKTPTVSVTGTPNEVPEFPIVRTSRFEIGGDTTFTDSHIATSYKLVNKSNNNTILDVRTTSDLIFFKIKERLLSINTNYELTVIHYGEKLGASEPKIINFKTRKKFIEIPDDGSNLEEPIYGNNNSSSSVVYYGNIPYNKLIGDRDYLGEWNGTHEYQPGEQCLYKNKLWYCLDTATQPANTTGIHRNVNRVPDVTDANGVIYWKLDDRNNLPTYRWLLNQIGFAAGKKDWGHFYNKRPVDNTGLTLGEFKQTESGISKIAIGSRLLYIFNKNEVGNVSYDDIALHYIAEPRSRTIRIGERLYWLRVLTKDEYKKLYRFIHTPTVEEANGEDLSSYNGKLPIPIDLSEKLILARYDTDPSVPPGDIPPTQIGTTGITQDIEENERTGSLKLVLEYIPEYDEPRYYMTSLGAMQYDRYTDTGYFGITPVEVNKSIPDVFAKMVRTVTPTILEDNIYKDKLDNATKINREHTWLSFYWHGRHVLIARLPIAYGMKFSSLLNLKCLLPKNIKSKNTSCTLLEYKNSLYDVQIPIAYPIVYILASMGNKAEDAPAGSFLARANLYRRSMWNELIYRVAEKIPLEVDTHEPHGGYQIGKNWDTLSDINLGVFEHYSGNGAYDHHFGIIDDPATDRTELTWVNDDTKAFKTVSRGGKMLEDIYYYLTTGFNRNDHGLRLVLMDMKNYNPYDDFLTNDLIQGYRKVTL